MASPIASGSCEPICSTAWRGRSISITCNPPYVAEVNRPGLQPEVRDHEPAVALFGGVDGLGIVARVVADAPHRLRPGGYLLFEFGYGQDEEVESWLRAPPASRCSSDSGATFRASRERPSFDRG